MIKRFRQLFMYTWSLRSIHKINGWSLNCISRSLSECRETDIGMSICILNSFHCISWWITAVLNLRGSKLGRGFIWCTTPGKIDRARKVVFRSCAPYKYFIIVLGNYPHPSYQHEECSPFIIYPYKYMQQQPRSLNGQAYLVSNQTCSLCMESDNFRWLHTIA